MCATPRSGSTLLCELLAATGVAGRPAEHVEALRRAGRPREPREYLTGIRDASVLELLPEPEPAPSRRAPPSARAALAAALRAGTTPNGVFGTKVMWGYLADLLERLGELPALAGLEGAARVEAALGGDVTWVHVARADRVAQAVSLWRALQTRAWRADTRDAARPVYSFAAIDHLVRMLAAHDAAWAAWLPAQGVEPLRLTYDGIAGDSAGAVARVLDALGVAAPAGCPPAPLRRQAGAESAAWAARYRDEAASSSSSARIR